MAYNYRPKSSQDIKDLGVVTSKEKVLVSLFEEMKSSFGKSFDEQTLLNTAYSIEQQVNFKSQVKDWWM